jgi:hypothetical protein
MIPLKPGTLLMLVFILPQEAEILQDAQKEPANSSGITILAQPPGSRTGSGNKACLNISLSEYFLV